MEYLTIRNIISPRENSLFILLVIISSMIWLCLTICTAGVIWIIAAVIGFMLWMSNGLLIASLRADAVSVHRSQIDRLDKTLFEVCDTLGLSTTPELYVVQAGGLLNAFATRHSGRHFVVVYADMLEAFGPDSCEMKFLLGHEIGHIRRNHLFKQMLLLPALLLPIIGAAYSRACESTCDRYGALAANDLDASTRAMMTLAGGKEAAKQMDPSSFAKQNKYMRGFFVSWYELTSGYPTLSRRVKDLIDLKTGEMNITPRRHPLAYLLALLSFGGGFGGRGGLYVTLMLVYGIFVMMLFLQSSRPSTQQQTTTSLEICGNCAPKIAEISSGGE